jgi:DNA-binding NarL/FixJ family response regulator
MPETQDSPRLNDLSVALIAPETVRRQSITQALAGSQFKVEREFSAWPSQGDLHEIARLKYPVTVVDLDSDTDRALRVIEDLCSRDVTMTVIAFSGRSDATLLRRSMQAGAREFLIEPVQPETVREAFLRAKP